MTKKVDAKAIVPADETTWAQYAAMVEWLEIKTNFNLLVGAATAAMCCGLKTYLKVCLC
jgi:hypothetical protein